MKTIEQEVETLSIQSNRINLPKDPLVAANMETSGAAATGNSKAEGGKLSGWQRLTAAWRQTFTRQGRLDAKAMLRGELSQDKSDVMRKLPPLE